MGEDSKNIVITSAVRTPIGTFRGSLKDLEAKDLGALVTKESLKRSNLNPNDVDELIMGQVLTSGAGQNPARQAAMRAGRQGSKEYLDDWRRQIETCHGDPQEIAEKTASELENEFSDEFLKVIVKNKGIKNL